jgi:glucokinase
LADLKVVRSASASLADFQTFDDFADLLHRIGKNAAGTESNIAGASLAVPGPFDCKAGVSLMEHKLEPLYGKDLRGALAQRFGWNPNQLRFLNDACAYVLGEVGGGSLRGASRAAGLTLGTGIGCAFVVAGRHVTEGEGVPPGGEIWNFPYGTGTVEDLLSTRALNADYRARTGFDLEVSAIARRAARDAEARAVFETFGQHLGDVLRDVIAPFRPDKVMVGGGISRSASLFLPIAERQIAGLGFSVVTSKLLDQAPLVGAGQFWREEAGNKEVGTATAAARANL